MAVCFEKCCQISHQGFLIHLLSLRDFGCLRGHQLQKVEDKTGKKWWHWIVVHTACEQCGQRHPELHNLRSNVVERLLCVDESSFRLSNALSLPTGDQGRARTLSIPSASHLSDSGILLTFAERVLIAVPCSLTTTASDDELSIPTNTPEWNRGSHFPPLADLADMYRIFSPTSRIGVLSRRRCSLCSGVFPSLPTSHRFIR